MGVLIGEKGFAHFAGVGNGIEEEEESAILEGRGNRELSLSLRLGNTFLGV